VRVCLEWQRIGLAAPPEVEAETEEYCEEQDILAGFITDKCVEGPNCSVNSDPLYIAYKDWYQLNGEKQEAQNKSAVALRERGYTKVRTKKARVWQGIALRDGEDPSPGDGPVTTRHRRIGHR
jgi:putative DNA primase/helicase